MESIKSRIKVGDYWDLGLDHGHALVFQVISISDEGITSRVVIPNNAWQQGAKDKLPWQHVERLVRINNSYKYLDTPLYKVLNGDK